MKGFIGVTDYDWYDFLRVQPDLDEVNFWRPSGKGMALAPGTPFLFKLKVYRLRLPGHKIGLRGEA